MHLKTQKAFTMVELIFVIIIIGILSAIAIPKFGQTANIAYDSKAKSQLSAVMSTMSTERQKRILRGSGGTAITDLGDPTYAFNTFDSGTTKVVSLPIKNCTSGQTGCWARSTSTPRTFTYKFSGSTDTAVFKISNNRLVCNSSVAAQVALCNKLLY